MPTLRLTSKVLMDQTDVFEALLKASKTKRGTQIVDFSANSRLSNFHMVAHLTGQKHPFSKRMRPFQFTAQRFAPNAFH